MNIDLTGKVAIVTGAGGAIGRAVSLLLAQAGAKVLAADLDKGKAGEVADLIDSSGARALWIETDVSRGSDVAAYVKLALDAWGRIDILMNNAGWQGPVAPLVECPDEAFDAVMAVNARGVFLGLKHTLPVMFAQGAGAIVNTASLGSYIGTRNLAPYVASKHAVMGLTKTAALEAARRGVRVNAVCPGPVETPLLDEIESEQAGGNLEGLRRRRTASIPQGRYARPEEVANLMVFLASDLASHIVGQGVHVNGGSYV
jgi:NAD(P)-dependent dehydrogenase (short-subunit alcohol dehydrogenase family)